MSSSSSSLKRGRNNNTRDDILRILEQSRFGFNLGQQQERRRDGGGSSSNLSKSNSSDSTTGRDILRNRGDSSSKSGVTVTRGSERVGGRSQKIKGRILPSGINGRTMSTTKRTRAGGTGVLASATSFRGGKEVGRAEFQEMRHWIKQLQRDAEKFEEQDLRSATDVDFVNAQIRAMRKAFTTLGDIILEEIDGLRTDASMDLRDSESKISRAVLELAARLDRLELRCSVNHKDTKANKGLLQDTMTSQHTLRKEMSTLQQDVRQRATDNTQERDKIVIKVEDLSQKVSRIELSCRESIQDIQRRIAFYLQSLEMQLAEVLERLGARVLEIERVQQRQVMLYHDVLDSVSQIRVEMHRVSSGNNQSNGYSMGKNVTPRSTTTPRHIGNDEPSQRLSPRTGKSTVLSSTPLSS